MSSLEREKELKFIIDEQRKRKIYKQIWDKIKEFINSVNGVNFRFSDYSRDRNVIRFDTDDTLPLDAMVNVCSITIVIGSIYKTCCDRFYPQIYFKNCIYKKCLVTYPSLCSTCVTYRTLCHALGHQVLPTQSLPREAEDFPRGDKYFKHVPPPTYLIYFTPKGYT